MKRIRMGEISSRSHLQIINVKERDNGFSVVRNVIVT